MTEPAGKTHHRLDSIDLLRGLVMVIMLLDHTREFVHADALRFSPTDLTRASAALFFTRWVTHFCAPTFVLLAGMSAYLQLMRGKSRAELSRFLVKRGLWLILLEFTLVRLAVFFNFDYSFLGLASVIWVIGVSMIVLAGLIFLPARVVGALGVATVALHNMLDGVRVPAQVAMAGTPPPDALQKLWLVLHQPGFFKVFDGGPLLFVAYPLVPWVGVMAAGYALGVVYGWGAARRRRWLLRAGVALTALFVIVRATNAYGDPQPRAGQASALYSALSFLNATKYPASLLFLLMTLGPALVFLAWADGARERGVVSRALVAFGRVPLFYYLMQFAVAHALAVLLSAIAGKSYRHLFLNFPASVTEAPPDAGFPLWVVYAAWLGVLLILHPLCLWYGKVEQRHRGWPFSYI